jgi:hypothetical protein
MLRTFCFPMVFVSLLGVSKTSKGLDSILRPLRATGTGNSTQSDFWETEARIRRGKNHVTLHVKISWRSETRKPEQSRGGIDYWRL